MEKNSDRWWRNEVGYIVYPEAFKDGNGDGIGDLKGLISKLDYLKDLGVGMLWICPIFASPMEDNGYDVSDYYAINPRFGSLEDLKLLLSEAHKRNIRILLDLVLNHTSKEHPWFQKALADPSSEERSYYIFRKGKMVGDKLLPPSNWGSFFTPSCWEKVEGSDEFYFHAFGSGMPDVDWSNPKVRELYAEIADFYIKLGVDGFRLDAVAHLAKDLSFTDSDLYDEDGDGFVLDPSKFSNRPELFHYLEEFREKALKGRSVLLIGEVGGSVQPYEGKALADRLSGPLDLLFNFDTVWNNGNFGSIGKKDEEIVTDVMQLKHNFTRWYDACHSSCDMPLYWCNHDHPRLLAQYGSRIYRKESAKALALTLLFLYGTPFLYQGEELAMDNLIEGSIEDFAADVGTADSITSYRKAGYSDEQILSFLRRAARMNARTPLSWDSSPYGGFSEVKPLLPYTKDYLAGYNAKVEHDDPYSVLNFYRSAIALRKNTYYNNLVQNSQLEWIDWNHQDVISYLHRGYTTIMVITNMRPYQVYFTFNFQIADVLLHNYDGVLLSNHVLTLRPFESYLLVVK